MCIISRNEVALDSLPVDVLVNIMRRLDRSSACRIAMTNQKLRDIAKRFVRWGEFRSESGFKTNPPCYETTLLCCQKDRLARRYVELRKQTEETVSFCERSFFVVGGLSVLTMFIVSRSLNSIHR